MKDFSRKETVRKEIVEKDGFEYKYELTLSKGQGVASYGVPLYSISIEMLKIDTDELTRNGAVNLFSDFDIASDFFDRMIEGLATPIDLPYIIEDEFSK